VRVVWWIASVATTLFLGLPALAAAAGDNYIALYKADKQAVYDDSTATVQVQQMTSTIYVTAQQPNGDNFGLQFAAPTGQQLRTGIYDPTWWIGQGSDQHPVLQASSSTEAVETSGMLGRFEVFDVGYGSDGQVNRLWATWEIGGLWFGEVRVGEPSGSGALALAPRRVRWAETDIGRPQPNAPVRIVGRTSARVVSVAVTGPDASAFPIRGDQCTGVALTVGSGCSVVTGFVPAHPGTNSAQLDVTGSDGNHYTAALEGFAHGGITRVAFDSDPDDWIGQGGHIEYTTAEPSLGFCICQSPTSIVWGMQNSQDFWSGDFSVPNAQFASGHYDAIEWRSDPNRPGIEVAGDGRGCGGNGWFDISQIKLDVYGRIRNLAMTYAQHCGTAAASLWGSAEFRAGDTAAWPPWATPAPLRIDSDANSTRPADQTPPVDQTPPSADQGTTPAPIDSAPATASPVRTTVSGESTGAVAGTRTALVKPACRVPNLVGRRYSVAVRILARTHCRLGRVTGRRGPNARVVAQTPRRGKRANGARLALRLKSP
jgi:hypothetical protein